MKKKLFTLLTLLVLCVTGAWAQYFSATPLQTLDANVSFSTETQLTSTYATISGGNMYFETSSNQTAIEKQSSYYSFKMANSAQGFKIVLNQALANGDVISASILNNGSGDGNRRGIYITTSSSRPGSAPASTIYPASAESKMYQTDTYTVTTGDGICGESTIYIWRYTSNSTYFKDFTITRPVITKVATPTFTPNGATFTTSQSVTLACATDDSSIYYTTDGTTPSKTNGTLYSSAINLTSSTTIKAIAVDDNETLEDSEVATATFTKVIATPWNSWDFTNWSSATQAGVRADETNWDDHEESGNKDLDDKCYSNKAANSTFVYGSPATTIPETKGLTFATTAYRFGLAFDLSSTTIATGGYHGSQYLWLYGSNSVITIPSVPAGATIEIGFESHKLDGTADATRTLNVTNTDKGSVSTDAYTEETFTVSTTGNVTIYPSKGMHIYYITITAHVATVPITTASGKNYATYVTTSDLDFSSVSDDIKAYVAASTASAGSITFTGKDEVPAGTPLLIKTASAGATVNVPVAASAPAAIATNYLVAGTGSNVTYDASASHFYYILTNGEFKQANNSPVAVGKAYLALPSAATSNELTINFDDEAGDVTGIATISSKKQNYGEYYNLNGQRVDASHKGIVIVNGKKFFNK